MFNLFEIAPLFFCSGILSGSDANRNAGSEGTHKHVQIVQLAAGIVSDQVRVPLAGLLGLVFQRVLGLVQLAVYETFGLIGPARALPGDGLLHLVRYLIDLLVDLVPVDRDVALLVGDLQQNDSTADGDRGRLAHLHRDVTGCPSTSGTDENLFGGGLLADIADPTIQNSGSVAHCDDFLVSFVLLGFVIAHTFPRPGKLKTPLGHRPALSLPEFEPLELEMLLLATGNFARDGDQKFFTFSNSSTHWL